MSHSEAPSLDSLLAHEAWIGALARSLVASDHDADDLVQEIYVAALTRRPRSADPRGWIASVARNLVRSQRRGDLRRARREAEAARLEALPSAAELVERAALHRTIVSAVLDLPEPFRSTLLFRYFEGLPPRLIARRDGVPVETVRTRLKRGRELLRATLDGQHDDRRDAWTALVLLHHGTRPVAVASGAGAIAAKFAIGFALVATAIVATRLLVGGDDEGPPDPTPATAETVRSAAPRDPERDPTREATRALPDRPEVEHADVVPPTSEPLAERTGIHGRVTDPRGIGVPGASVTALALYDRRAEWERQGTALEALRTVRADADGHYALGRFGAPVLLRVDADGMGRTYSFVATAGRRDLALPDGVRVTGRVVRGTEGPRPGAVVVLFERDCKVNVFGFRDDGEAFQSSTTVSYAQAVTGSTGAFAIPDVAPGRYRVAVFERDGPVHAPRDLTIDVPSRGPTVADVRLPHRDAVEVAGVVRDVDGESIAGARVAVSGHPNRGARTDDDGRFRLRAIAGERLSLFAQKAGRLATASALTVPVRGVADAVLVLASPGAIVGRVVDSAGRPVGGASVVASAGHAPVRTESDGRFRLRGVRPGTTAFVVDAGARGGCRVEAVVVEPDEAVDCGEVRLPPAGSIVGRFEAPPGVAVGGVGLALRAIDGRPMPIGRGATTADDGHFRVAGVRPGRYRFAAWIAGQYHTFPDAIDVADGAASAVVLRVDAERAIAGRVVDVRGAPVFHARVAVTSLGDTATTDFRYTDEDGRFRLIGLRASRYRLRVESQGRHFKRMLTDVQPGSPSREIVLETKTPIQGRVLVAADGRPATTFWVRTFPHRDARAVAPGLSDRRRFRSDDGTFTIGIRHDPFGAPALIDGVYDIEAGAGDLVSSVARGVRFEGGAVARELVLRLRPGGRAAGRLVDPTGAAVGGARVVVYPVDGSARRYAVESDAHGRFAVGPLAPGHYRVDATHPDGVARARIAIAPGATTDEVIALGRPSRLRVDVRTDDGEPAGHVAVSLVASIAPVGATPRAATTDARGTVGFDRLLPGDYELHVSSATRQRSRTTIRVDAGTDRHVTIELRALRAEPARSGRKGEQR